MKFPRRWKLCSGAPTPLNKHPPFPKASASRIFSLNEFSRVSFPPPDRDVLAPLCRRSQSLTQQRFGKVIRLPSRAALTFPTSALTIGKYCGFSRDNPILRVTLSVDEVLREARSLKEKGFRNILLGAGEHPKFVSNNYLADCIRALHQEIPGVLARSRANGNGRIPPARPSRRGRSRGLSGNLRPRAIYAEMHTAGPKRNFNWRLETPERAYAAGFRRLGIGALFGLSDWRREAIAVAAHADYLLRNCWKAQLTVSLPRLRPSAGEFEPLTQMTDRDLVQLICAFRLFLPDAGLVLSTREPATLRNGLIPLGVTMISAGSHTEPGGYTGAGRDKIHHTERGRIVEIASGSSEWAANADRATNATGQFDIADQRSPEEMADLIRRLGYEPVWKDWDAALTA